MFEEPFLEFAGRLRQKGEVDLLHIFIQSNGSYCYQKGRRTYSVDPIPLRRPISQFAQARLLLKDEVRTNLHHLL